MGFKKWFGDVLGKIVANVVTGIIFLVALFFGVGLLMKWLGI